MNRTTLSFFSVLLLCAPSCYALAEDSTARATSEQQIRQQVDTQRAELTGAATLAPPPKTGASQMLDLPVETDDAPTQAQRP